MKKIYLLGERGADKFALVDNKDYKCLNQFKWYLHTAGYAVRLQPVYGQDSRWVGNKSVFMHRQILGLTRKRHEVDHINGLPLDNRRSNLRKCTHQQNCLNKTRTRSSTYFKTSKYKGVSWSSSRNAWRARVSFKGKEISLGFFNNEEEAYLEYINASKILGGEFTPQYKNIPKASIGGSSRRSTPGVESKYTKYRGLHRRPSRNRWEVRFVFKGNQIYGGTFSQEEKAAEAYNILARKYLGDKAKLNNIKRGA